VNEKAELVVIGESKARDGSDNPVMRHARHFVGNLERETGLPVVFEPEFYSSAEARLLKEQSSGRVEALVDAEAAAIILNSYIARTKKSTEHV
jgi:RNase H-fold protein (predicted Holliday junction resolvase)